MPIIVDHLKDRDSLSLPHYISSCLFVFAEIVLFSTSNYQTIKNYIESILTMIKGSDYLNSESPVVLEAVLLLTTNIIKSCGKYCSNYKRVIFKTLLQLGSVPGTSHLHGQVEQTIKLLALHCGFENSSELFSMELEHLLIEMKETYMIWDESTPDRFIFDMLCRKSDGAVVEYWDLIIEIVGMNCTHERAYNLRMDMLALVEHFLDKEVLQDTL